MHGGSGGSKHPKLMSPEFDAIAQDYDATFSHSAVGRMQRERVWAKMEQFHLPPNARVLELSCGTGEDAIWMAQKGWNVLATDASPGMIAVAKTKADKSGLTARLQLQVCSFAAIETLPEGNFDLIFSNFGGLNCVSPEELSKLGKVFAQKLKPGGKFIAVVMGRFCWWETLYFLLKMKPRAAFRRFSKKPVDARLDAQTSVPTWYYSPAAFGKLLGFSGPKPEASPVGVWLPPSYLNPFFEKRPRFLGFLNFLERKLAPAWMASLADHFLICVEGEANPRAKWP